MKKPNDHAEPTKSRTLKNTQKQLLKSTTCHSTIKPNISTQRFAEYFRAVNDPQLTFFITR